jgi:hypothetical protein
MASPDLLNEVKKALVDTKEYLESSNQRTVNLSLAYFGFNSKS